jgi:glycosyltransferase involved in cell wall biosynthesis
MQKYNFLKEFLRDLKMKTKISIITVTRSRPQLLARAIGSLKAQTSQDFEWIVVNDGEDTATERIVRNADLYFPHTYLGMTHPDNGFALAHGRNKGLSIATGDIITYLDDDNTFKPNFVTETLAFFERNPQVSYSMPVQQRRRDILRDGVIVASGKEFFSPTPDCTIEQSIRHEQLIDSNGFCHQADTRLSWNPELRIYLDYEFLLRCIDLWGRSGFGINPAILVDYVQTNQGIIGGSSYQDWASELEWIIEHRSNYPCLNDDDVRTLDRLNDEYRLKSQNLKQIKAFQT